MGKKTKKKQEKTLGKNKKKQKQQNKSKQKNKKRIKKKTKQRCFPEKNKKKHQKQKNFEGFLFQKKPFRLQIPPHPLQGLMFNLSVPNPKAGRKHRKAGEILLVASLQGYRPL